MPDDVLAQLGNRVQHALRAFTPDDAKALQGDGRDLPDVGDYDLGQVLLHARHRRGDRHRDVRARRADPGGLDPAAGARSR